MLMGVSVLGILVAAIVAMMIGGVWFGPLFGEQWMKAMDYSKADVDQEGMGKWYGIAFVNSLVMMFVLAYFIGVLGDGTLGGATAIGLWLWLGFLLTQQVGALCWSKNHSVPLLFITSAYWLVITVISSIIVFVV